VLAVPASNPANSLPEFVAWAKKQGGKLSYGSVGNGSSSHLTMELFKSVTGIDAVHVPYAGSPPAGTSLAAGETQMLFTVAPALLPLIQGKRVKLIAATSAQRTELMKDLPTVAESGYPGFEALAWNGLFTAAGTPAEVVNRINADVNAVMKEPAVRELLAKQGLIAGGGTPAEFKAFIDSEGASGARHQERSASRSIDPKDLHESLAQGPGRGRPRNGQCPHPRADLPGRRARARHGHRHLRQRPARRRLDASYAFITESLPVTLGHEFVGVAQTGPAEAAGASSCARR
jgi:hypothetical protein